MGAWPSFSKITPHHSGCSFGPLRLVGQFSAPDQQILTPGGITIPWGLCIRLGQKLVKLFGQRSKLKRHLIHFVGRTLHESLGLEPETHYARARPQGKKSRNESLTEAQTPRAFPRPHSGGV
jgi:hypothetical protein